MKNKIDYAAQAQALRNFELKYNFMINAKIRTYDNEIGRAIESKEKWENYITNQNGNFNNSPHHDTKYKWEDPRPFWNNEE